MYLRRKTTSVSCSGEHQIVSPYKGVKCPSLRSVLEKTAGGTESTRLFPYITEKVVQEFWSLVNIAAFCNQHSEHVGEFATSRKDLGCTQEIQSDLPP